MLFYLILSYLTSCKILNIIVPASTTDSPAVMPSFINDFRHMMERLASFSDLQIIVGYFNIDVDDATS